MGNVHAINHEPFQKRIPQHVDLRKDITRYDIDNLYPQRVEEIAFRSPITNTAVNITADFLNGEGFSNNADFVIDQTTGKTINELLWQVSQDMSPFNGFAIHMNFNMLGEAVQYTHVPFKWCRFGLPDEQGRHSEMAVNINWEEDRKLLPQGVLAETKTFPLFNPADPPKSIPSEGMILYWTPIRDKYPRASFDSVLDSSQLNGDIQAFELANMQNGFHGSSIFRYPGEFESEKERQKTIGELRQMKGVHGGNSTMLVEMPLGTENYELLENLPANNNDRLFELTNRNVVERIMQAFGMPGPLAAVFPPSGAIFNQNEISDAYVYYNNRVRNRRMVLERVFNSLGNAFVGSPQFGEIIEQEFEVKGGVKTEETNDGGNTTNN